MHSSHHTKFQPEWWLPDPVRARFDVFQRILASLNSLLQAVAVSQQPRCAVVAQQQPLCGCHTQPVWLLHSLCGFHTEAMRMGRERDGTGRAVRGKSGGTVGTDRPSGPPPDRTDQASYLHPIM